MFKWSVVDDWTKPDGLTGALALGTRVHAAIEEFHRSGVDPVDAHHALARTARDKADSGPDWLREQLESDLLVGHNCATAYRKWVLDKDPYADFEVVGIEETVTTEILGGRVILQGKIDLILRHLITGLVTLEDFKGLSLDTPIPTPTGWATMGSLRVGDVAFDSEGETCRVTGKSDVKQIGTYVVTFDDGSQIVCDSEHLWWVRSGRASRGSRTEDIPMAVRPIAEIRDSVRLYGQAQHRVPVAGALNLPEQDLPVDPYLLGCWLGDGDSGSGNITKSDEFFDHLDALGYTLNKRKPDTRRPHVITCAPLELTRTLRRAGLQGNKHIPDQYLRASREQRLALLRGLMDTDGTWNKARSRCVINGTRKALMQQIKELALSLGFKPNLTPYTARGFGLVVDAYMLEFAATPENPFLWNKKRSQVSCGPLRAQHSSRRVIVSVEPGPDVPTACIAVDSPNRTYLCGEDMIPTHNTMAATRANQAQDFVLRSYQHPWYTNAATAMGHKVNAARYIHLKKVKDLSRTTDPVIVSTVPAMARTSRVAIGYIEEIVTEILTLMDRGEETGWYPTPADSCSWCVYRNPCLLAGEGRGSERMALADQFSHGTRLDRYVTIEEP